MELELIRTYDPLGTNGKILFQSRLMMYSIELPWKNNQTGVSCIPEGRYELIKRYTDKFGYTILPFFPMPFIEFGNVQGIITYTRLRFGKIFSPLCSRPESFAAISFIQISDY